MPTAHNRYGSMLQEFSLPLPLVKWWWIVGAPLPIAPRKSGSVLHEVHRPLPLGSVAEHCRTRTAQCTQAVR